MIPGNDRIPGSRHTAASETKRSSQHKVWGVWQTLAFTAFNIAKKTLFKFIDLTLCENGNCEENGSLTVGTAWHLHVCSLFPTGDWCEPECCTNVLSIGNTGKCLFFDGKVCLMLRLFWLGTGTGNVILGSWQQQQYQKQNALPNTRFEASGKLQLLQLSTLRRRHYSLIWLFAKMETVKRMVLSQWALLDTCMCVPCSPLVIDVNRNAARMSCQLATSANVCSLMAKFVWCSAFSGLELEQATWFFVAGSNSSIRNKTLFPTQGLGRHWQDIEMQCDSWRRQDSWKP